MKEQFEEAKANSARCESHNYMSEKDGEYIEFIKKEAEAFRDYACTDEFQNASEKSDWTFSWEER